MRSSDDPRTILAIASAVLFLCIGIIQVLYAGLAFLAIGAGALLGAFFIVASKAGASVDPERLQKIDDEQKLLEVIICAGMILALAIFIVAGRTLYRRQLSHFDLVGCSVLSSAIGVLHYVNGLGAISLAYAVATALWMGLLLFDYMIIRYQTFDRES